MPQPRVRLFAQQAQYSFVLEGRTVVLHPGEIMDQWRVNAARSGYDIVARVQDCSMLLIKCRTCGQLSIKRRSVVAENKPDCLPCIRMRLKAAAAKLGATYLGKIPATAKECLIQLSCGHVVRRQNGRLEAAANGGHAIGCEVCREARYDQVAARQGWRLAGPAASGRAGYRQYRHRCGHRQDVMVGNMRWGDVDCARCGESWTSKPSQLYLFRVHLVSGPLLKLGYSSNPKRRLRQQLGIAKGTPTQVLRTIPVPTGHEAIQLEKRAHTWMRRHHSDLIVPKSTYGDAINTRTEIYHVAAEAILHALLDRIERDLAQTPD